MRFFCYFHLGRVSNIAGALGGEKRAEGVSTRVEYRRCFGVGKRAEGVSTRVEYRRCFRGGKERKGGTRLSNIAGALPRLSPSVSAPVLDGRWRDGGEGKHVCRISPVLACRFYVHPHECVHDTNTMHA